MTSKKKKKVYLSTFSFNVGTHILSTFTISLKISHNLHIAYSKTLKADRLDYNSKKVTKKYS